MTINTGSTNWENKTIELHATATDNVKVAEIHLPNGSVVKSDEAVFEVTDNGTYKFVAVDTKGNRTEKSIDIKLIDRAAPYVQIKERQEMDDSVFIEFIYYDR